MGRLHILVGFVIFALLAPVVICVVPGTPTATAIPDCCQHMSAACGNQAGMAECCSFTIPEVRTTGPAAKVSALDIHAQDAVAPSSGFVLEIPEIERPGPFGFASPSPPVSPPGSLTILRI